MKNLFPLLAALDAEPPTSWAPVILLIIIAVGFASMNLLLSSMVGPTRTGPGKEQVYESGMMPIGDTRKRFNVRFYVVAMIFLVFDVEIVFFYPWATVFPNAVVRDPSMAGLMMVEMILFVAILLVAYIYAWGKGVFQWD